MKKQKINYSNANRVIKNTIQPYFLELSEKLGKSYNLKLYDVFYQCEELVNEAIEKAVKEYPRFEQDIRKYINNDCFYNFCDLEYDNFKTWSEENHIQLDEELQYIGRTSSFYIGDLHKIDGIINLLEKCYGGVLWISEKDHKLVPYISDFISYRDSLDNDRECLEYIINGDFLRDLKNTFSDDLLICDYIQDFKENQIECFREYLSFEVDYCISSCLFEQELEKQEKEQFCIDTATLIFV